ncbi:tRNA 2-selenouridine(34) synthase MnmH [Prochlorococcus sp. MIT 1300]|uniref:tRNA 2-selenouridine(34) synthase MnmH n=1 Tax=Prochlorococcus sp. MIT 1300 TaxID=3096218 RepID=UPI002A75D637|nr:tRNA 2-selenouridine(34) synthase MnmH [Prochlorococcus sp. MIT 1300]
MSGMGIRPHYPMKKFRDLAGPLIDLRSPSEFTKGHWPSAKNVPLFSDEQRSHIGTTYKKLGRSKAIVIGLKYAGPRLLVIAETLKGLLKEYKENYLSHKNKPINLKVYCWRGGMRSASIAWLAELLELNPAVLEGGYKTYRKWVLDQFEQNWPLHLLGGRTGTGKTDLLLVLEKQGFSFLDLEGLANHKGSSFGGLGLPSQPSTEHYENLISEKLESFNRNSSKQIWVEAESAHLGHCRVPQSLFKQMKEAPVLEICRTNAERVEHLVRGYSPHGKEALAEATKRISRRLGPQRTKEALEAISKEEWSSACEALLDYYDRCYDFGLDQAINRQTIHLSGLNPEDAAAKLIKLGLAIKSFPQQ